MGPRRIVLAVVALVAGAVAFLLARLRGGSGSDGGGGAKAAASSALAGPLASARRAASHLPGVGDGDGDGKTGVESWTCQCGQRYRVTGEGRHRVYWPDGAPESDPVLGGKCVSCERPLPGEHIPAAEAAETST